MEGAHSEGGSVQLQCGRGGGARLEAGPSAKPVRDPEVCSGHRCVEMQGWLKDQTEEKVFSLKLTSESSFGASEMNI